MYYCDYYSMTLCIMGLHLMKTDEKRDRSLDRCVSNISVPKRIKSFDKFSCRRRWAGNIFQRWAKIYIQNACWIHAFNHDSPSRCLRANVCGFDADVKNARRKKYIIVNIRVNIRNLNSNRMKKKKHTKIT